MMSGKGVLAIALFSTTEDKLRTEGITSIAYNEEKGLYFTTVSGDVYGVPKENRPAGFDFEFWAMQRVRYAYDNELITLTRGEGDVKIEFSKL